MLLSNYKKKVMNDFNYNLFEILKIRIGRGKKSNLFIQIRNKFICFTTTELNILFKNKAVKAS